MDFPETYSCANSHDLPSFDLRGLMEVFLPHLMIQHYQVLGALRNMGKMEVSKWQIVLVALGAGSVYKIGFLCVILSVLDFPV